MNDLSVGELLIEANRSIRSLTWDIGAINARGVLAAWPSLAQASRRVLDLLPVPGRTWIDVLELNPVTVTQTAAPTPAFVDAARLLDRAADLLDAYAPTGRIDIEGTKVARASVLLGLSTAAHTATVTLSGHIAAETKRRLPYVPHGAMPTLCRQFRDLEAVLSDENTLAGLGRMRADLPTDDVTLRVGEALIRWRVTATATLEGSPTRDDIRYVAQTEARLTAGLRHKAARGELRQGLPVGFDYDPDDNVVLAADEAVIEAIATVFRRFAELGSARQVMLSLREEGLLLPRRPGRTGRIQWAMATYPAVHDFLTNPCYAGAFVFGRNRSEKRLDGEGRVITRTVAVPRDQWTVLIPEHHRGFIDWPTYEANTAALRANWRPPRGSGGGAAREGAALLQGRIRCGRMMQTSYSGTNGNSPRYLCARSKQLYGHEKSCQSIGGRRLEQRVLEEVFAVLEPAALAATAKALRDAEQTHATHLRAFTLSVERARFDVDRARRQYDAVEPANRLVARTLERSLETTLTAQRQTERDLLAAKARRPVRLSDEELAWLSRAGADVRAVFAAPSTTFRERKQLLRAILTEVVLTVDHDKRAAAIRIIWQGGSSTELAMAMNKTGAHARTTDEDTVSLIGRLAGSYDDTTIALILSRQKRLTGTGLSFTKTRVKSLRVARGIPAYEPADQPVSADEQDVLVVNVPQAERILGVGKVTIYRWLADGFLTGEQLTAGAPWRIRIDQAVRDRLAPEVPEGWLRLADAAKALGMARQTVLHKVQSGELEAVQVNQGRRKGLRINVTAQQTGLFDQA